MKNKFKKLEADSVSFHFNNLHQKLDQENYTEDIQKLYEEKNSLSLEVKQLKELIKEMEDKYRKYHRENDDSNRPRNGGNLARSHDLDCYLGEREEGT